MEQAAGRFEQGNSKVMGAGLVVIGILFALLGIFTGNGSPVVLVVGVGFGIVFAAMGANMILYKLSIDASGIEISDILGKKIARWEEIDSVRLVITDAMANSRSRSMRLHNGRMEPVHGLTITSASDVQRMQNEMIVMMSGRQLAFASLRGMANMVDLYALAQKQIDAEIVKKTFENAYLLAQLGKSRWGVGVAGSKKDSLIEALKMYGGEKCREIGTPIDLRSSPAGSQQQPSQVIQN